MYLKQISIFMQYWQDKEKSTHCAWLDNFNSFKTSSKMNINMTIWLILMYLPASVKLQQHQTEWFQTSSEQTRFNSLFHSHSLSLFFWNSLFHLS